MQTVMNTSKNVFVFTKRATMKLRYLIIAERPPTKWNFRPKYVNNAKNQNQFADRWLKSKNWACYFFICAGVWWRWAGVWYLWVDVLRYWCAFVCYFLFIDLLAIYWWMALQLSHRSCEYSWSAIVEHIQWIIFTFTLNIFDFDLLRLNWKLNLRWWDIFLWIQWRKQCSK